MKTSFYFVIWVALVMVLFIYNLDDHIDNKSVTFIVIFFIPCLYPLINKLFFRTFKYAKTLEAAPILDAVFTGNINTFHHQLKHDFKLELISMAYMIIFSFSVSIIAIDSKIPIAIAITVGILISCFTISRVFTLKKAFSQLKNNPTPEQCREIVEKVYKLDYDAYCNSRNNGNAVPTSHPLSYNIYRGISIICAVVTSLIGCIFILAGLTIFFELHLYDTSTVPLLIFDLFLSLFCCFMASYPLFIGIRDIIALVRSKERRRYITLLMAIANIGIILYFILRERPNPEW